MHGHVRGFTLIEVLIVLVLVAVITTLAVTHLDRDDDRAGREARRLAAVLDIASSEAVMEARELGLVLKVDAYHFARLERGVWEPAAFENDRALSRHELPEGIRIHLRGDGLASTPATLAREGDDDRRPQVLILSSGELTPFEAEMLPAASMAPAWIIAGEHDGSVHYREVEP